MRKDYTQKLRIAGPDLMGSFSISRPIINNIRHPSQLIIANPGFLINGGIAIATTSRLIKKTTASYWSCKVVT